MFKLKLERRSTACEIIQQQQATLLDLAYMFSSAKSYLLEKDQRFHLNNAKMENNLIPWLVLGMIILIIKSMSCSVPWPCPDYGVPPTLGTAQDPVSPPGPSALSQWLWSRPVPRSLQSCQVRFKLCPGLSLSPCPGRCLMAKDGTVSVPPAACTLLGWQDRSWLSCLVSTDPHGQPPHPAGPWQLQESNTEVFFSRERPHAS